MASIKKLAPGKWQLRLKYKDKMTQKSRYLMRRFRTKAEAEAAELKIKNEINSEQNINEKITLVDFIEQWIEATKKGKVADNTYILYAESLSVHIKPYFQKLRLHDLNALDYQKFINYMRKKKTKRGKPYSKRTIEIVHGTVYGAMKYAYLTLHIIPFNPCEGVEIYTPREKAERKNKKNAQIKFMPFDKIGTFLDNAAKLDFAYYMFFKFLIESGCRKGEAMALQWSDIDFEKNEISINKTINYYVKGNSKDDNIFGDTKTYSSIRTIKIPQKFAEELKQYQSYQSINKKRLKNIYHDFDLVFCREDGRPFPKSTLYRAFNDLLERSGIEKIRIHALRHTHANLMLESGRRKDSVMKDLSERLGHSSIEVTDRIYTDATEKIKQDDIDEFEKYIDKFL